ncbi:pyrimidodiazepine synthase-like isoform X1 [Macrobrachium rosenbergii]|uniref:pyrimidodiazepine synthase-like isoform X1 n=2 Tax=Macrobrachium rosenbergii TaxID=79674 RepID=UPI0034D6AF91
MAAKGIEAAITLTTNHMGAGSLCPPLGIGVLRCYSMKYCPYAQRTRLVLLAKNIKHEVVNVNLRSKPGWLFEKNPLGKVPVLEKDGETIYESLITCDYLDEVYPNPPLYPSDPWKKAQDKVLIDRWAKVSQAWYKIRFAVGNEEIMAKALQELHEGLDIYESELKKRKTKFYGGAKPGMLDYMIWPWAERICVLQEISGDKFLTEERYPVLMSWMELMMSDPPVAETYLPLEAHMYFISTFDGKAQEVKHKEVSRL